MKRILTTILSLLFLVSCGTPVVTTGNTDESTNDPIGDVTEAPATGESFEVPDDPTFDPDEEDTSIASENIIFDLNFDNVDNPVSQVPDGFRLESNGWSFNAGEDGYFQNDGINGIVRLFDKNMILDKKCFIWETEITFDKLPTKAEGVTNFPLSVLTWVRKAAGGDYYEWALKIDDQGYIYVENASTRTNTKIEAGKKYTFANFYDANNGQLHVMLDGETVAVKKFVERVLTASSLRLFDVGTEKGHFSAKLHGMRAYYCDESQLLKDAEKDIFTALSENANASAYFMAYTNKDALSYEVGEEMSFDIYLMCNGKVVSAPYFYYSVAGEDGQEKTEGYADGSKGHFTVKAKLSKPGAVRVIAYVCDQNKVKQTKNNSPLHVKLETSTPQNADLCFKGGAIAGFDQITAGGKIPTDLAEYWDGVINNCYRGDIKLLRFEPVDSSKYSYDMNTYHLYIVEIECAGGFVTGYLSVPKNADKLVLSMSFVSYGNKKKPTPSFNSKGAVFTVCAHSYKLDDPNAAAPDQYGFNETENQNRDTVYFKNMFIRNVTAARFLKAYIGSVDYGRITFNGQTVSPLGKWSRGDSFSVNGGSQASFQAVALTAMDEDVTKASFGVPWFCDIGGDLVGRFSGWNPNYTDALMYYDSVALATLIGKNVEASITAGLGDTTSEPSGVVALYNALNCKKSMTMYQNREHTYNPPVANKYKISSSN